MGLFNLDLAGVDVGAGELDITAGGSLTDSAANTAGAVTLAVSGDATLDNANDFDSIAGTAANLTVNDVDDLKIAGVTAPAGRIQVNAGNIVMGSVTAGTAGFNANGSVSDDGSDVNAGVLTIIASGDIGSKDKPIQMTAKEIRTISGRNVHLRENTREGVVKLESIKAQGDISLVAKDIGGPTGRNGGFIDANGDAVNLQAGNDILVDAGGWFGTYSDPMEVVFGGNFTIRSVNDRDVNNGTRRTPISESPVGLVIADGRILGGTPELIRRLNRAFAYTANTPELKCSQGTFGRPVFFHTLPSDSEAKSVSVVDRLDVDADKNTHGEDLSVVDDMLEDGTFKSWNPRPDDAVLRNWTDESKSDRASRPQSDIQESEN